MTVPLQKIDLVNIACGFLGEPALDSIDAPSTKEEQSWARVYDTVREDLLRAHNWNFAFKLATITRSGTPAHTWDDKYALPDDYLRLVKIEGESVVTINATPLSDKKYKISQREILINRDGDTSIDIEYIANVTDLSLWDANVRIAFAKKLAQEMVFFYEKNNRTVERLEKEYMIALKLAIQTDVAESPPVVRSISKTKQRRVFYTGGPQASMVEDWNG